MDSVNIKLKSPGTANGEGTSELTLREPAGKDITQCGMPFRFSGGEFDRSNTLDSKVVANYIVALGNVTAQVVDGLKGPDWLVISQAVALAPFSQNSNG